MVFSGAEKGARPIENREELIGKRWVLIPV